MGLIKDALFSDAGLCEFSAIQWRTPPPPHNVNLSVWNTYMCPRNPLRGLKQPSETLGSLTHTPLVQKF